MKEVPSFLNEVKVILYSKGKEKCKAVKCKNCLNIFFARIVDLNKKQGKGSYCSHSCVAKKTHTGRIRADWEKEKLSASKTKERNPNWKGDKVGWWGGHDRAQRWYKLEPCVKCKNKKTERHHLDGNFRNNDKENIQFLCRFHHMEIDGRLHKPKI